MTRSATCAAVHGARAPLPESPGNRAPALHPRWNRGMTAPALHVRAILSLLLVVAAAGCSDPVDSEAFRFSGDWCTEGTLSTAGTPVTALAHIGGVFLQEGDRVRGSGAVKRAGDDRLWPSRYAGDIIGERLLLEVTPLEEDPEAPRFSVDLERRTANEMSGPSLGDPGFTGTITLVRLGPRCFS